MSTAPGTIGRYQIQRSLGSGGMGTVYLAWDPSIDRFVAIKLVRQGMQGREILERFTREARSIGRLRHPNIVTIFDVGEHQGEPFIAMEYVQGQTLADLIHAQSALSLVRRLHIVEELCAALAHAHDAGIVHRDIKPANVMVGADGVVKILDFGIARFGPTGLTQGVIGTLNYMAPEQLEGKAIDHRVDIFSIGALFYELVSYRRAFPGDVADGVLIRIMTGQPEPLDAVVPNLDPGVVAIANGCLEKRAEDRYPDCRTLARDVAAVRTRLQHTDPWLAPTIRGSGTGQPAIPTPNETWTAPLTRPTVAAPTPVIERATVTPSAAPRSLRVAFVAALVGVLAAVVVMKLWSGAQQETTSAAPTVVSPQVVDTQASRVGATTPPAAAANTVPEPAPSPPRATTTEPASQVPRKATPSLASPTEQARPPASQEPPRAAAIPATEPAVQPPQSGTAPDANSTEPPRPSPPPEAARPPATVERPPAPAMRGDAASRAAVIERGPQPIPADWGLFGDPHGRFAIQFPKDWQWLIVAGAGEAIATFDQPQGRATVVVERFRMKTALSSADISRLFATYEADVLSENQPQATKITSSVVLSGNRRYVVVDYARPAPGGFDHVRLYSLPSGSDLLRVTCAASESRFNDYETVFDAMAESLRSRTELKPPFVLPKQGNVFRPNSGLASVSDVRDGPRGPGRTTKFLDSLRRFAIEFPKGWQTKVIAGSGEPLSTFVQPSREAALVVEHFRMRASLTPNQVTDVFAQVETDVLKENQPRVANVNARVVMQGQRRLVQIDYNRPGIGEPGKVEDERVRQFSFPINRSLYRITCVSRASQFGKYEGMCQWAAESLTPGDELTK